MPLDPKGTCAKGTCGARSPETRASQGGAPKGRAPQGRAPQGRALRGRAPLRQALYRIGPLALFLGVWQFATLFFSPLVLPPIPDVADRLAAIVCGEKFWPTVSVTLLRLVAGLGLGVLIGSAVGLLFGASRTVEAMFSPFVAILQTVPPVCWVVLALVWFGFNGRPSVFIVATATIPTMVISLCNGVRSIDPKLLEMARAYRFSRWKTLRHVLLPSVEPYFRSALEIVIGNGWKLVVMGEVLTTSSGIGGAITTARLNVEPDAIIAWAVLLVLFCFGTQAVLRLALRRKGGAKC